MQQAETILGIDVGASGLKGAIIDVRTGKLVTERFRIPTPQPATPKAVTEVFVQIVKHFDWKGDIGCGFPAVIREGVALTAANIDESWIGVNVQKMFSDATGCKTMIINDADAAGVAELYFGSGDGLHGLVIMLTLGTGIGSVIFSDGVLIPNTELGHIYLKNAKKVAEQYTSDGVRKKKELSWDKFGERLNEYLTQIQLLFSPDVIVLGGGGSKEFDKYKKHLKLNTKVIPAQMLNDAGIVGAAYYAYCKLNNLELKGMD